MTIEEFYSLCEKHDWHYARSDSMAVYHAGAKSFAVITNAASVDGKKEKLLKEWVGYIYEGKDKPVI